MRKAAALLVVLLAGHAGAQLTEPVDVTSAQQYVTATFTTGGTLGNIFVSTQGDTAGDFLSTSNGTCTIGNVYAAGDSCTVGYVFRPSWPGLRLGGVTLQGTTKATLGNAYMSGTGTGPLVRFPTGVVTPYNLSGTANVNSIAVDDVFNIYVLENAGSGSSANELVEYTAGGARVVVDTSFQNPVQVTVDGVGNVYVADAGAKYVVKETLNGTGWARTNLFADARGVSGVAVDGAGNVYVGIPTLGVVEEVLAPLGTYTAQTVYGNPTFNYTLAVGPDGTIYFGSVTVKAGNPGAYPGGSAPSFDAAGNVYTSVGGSVYKDTPVSGGGYTQTLLATVSGTVTSVSVNSWGVVFFSTTSASAPVEYLDTLNFATAPTLSFAPTQVGQTSSDSPKSLRVQNAGNTPLTILSSGGVTPNPSITAGFMLGSGTCPNSAQNGTGNVVAPGAECTYSVSFVPVAVGPANGSLTLNDDCAEISGGVQVVPLAGTGLAAGTPPSVSSVVPNTGPTTGGTDVVITGVNFTGATSVMFGPRPATSFTVVSGTQIDAVSPANAAGTVDVSVTTPQGTSAGTAADRFTYQVVAQTITFPAPVSPAFAGTSALLAASSSSGLPVTYKVVSGPATVSGNVATYLAQGTVILEADQPGDSGTASATPVQQTVNVVLLTEPIGTQSPIVTTVVSFSTAGTVATVGVYQQGALGTDFSGATGGDCATGTTYAVGQTCTVAFTFKPTRPGIRFGGISLTSSAGSLLANSYISGLGVGPQVVFTPATQSVVGASLNAAPSGVAVDGAANVYVSDYGGTVGVGEILAGGGVRKFGNLGSTDDVTVDGSGNVFICTRTQVYELMAVNGAMPANPMIRQIAASQVGVAFFSLNGMKVDRNGNVFLANSGSTSDTSTVLELLAVNGVMPDEPVVRTLVTGIGEPTGVALDVNGNVFVSDEASAVKEIMAVNGVVPDNPVVRTITSPALGEPTNIAVDAIGDIYVSDYTTGFLEEMLAVNGSVPTTGATVLTVGTGLTEGQGITLDPSGVIYVAVDTIPGPVKLDYTQAPTLNFAPTIVGQTSSDSPKTVTLQNNGNADLTFTGTNPQISVGFGLVSGSSCPQSVSGGAGGTLAPGAVCSEMVNFTPTFVGNDHGTLVITDDYLNSTGVTQTVVLNGTGLPIPPALSFTVPNHFVDDPPFTVTATSNSPAPVAYSYMSGPATLAGNVVTLTGTVGTVMLKASQAAQGNFDAGSVTATFQVTKHSQTITFPQPQSPARLGFGPITLQATASSGLPVVFTVLSGPAIVSGNQLTLTAAGTVVVAANQPGNAIYDAAPEVTRTIVVIDPTVKLTLTAAPNPVFVKNPVTFTATLSYAGGTATSAVQFFEGSTLLGTGTLVNGTVATFTTSALTIGTHTIYAVYPGDNLFSPGTSNSVDVLVEDFSLVIHNPDVTISHGGTAVYNLTVTTVGGTGMASAIGFTLGGGPPDHSPATFHPGSVATGSGTTDFTLTIATPDYPVGPFSAVRSMGGGLSLAFGSAGILFALFGKRRARKLAAVMVLMAGLGLSGCVQQWGTQTYSISVTATSGALSHTVNATLTSK